MLSFSVVSAFRDFLELYFYLYSQRSSDTLLGENQVYSVFLTEGVQSIYKSKCGTGLFTYMQAILRIPETSDRHLYKVKSYAFPVHCNRIQMWVSMSILQRIWARRYSHKGILERAKESQGPFPDCRSESRNFVATNVVAFRVHWENEILHFWCVMMILNKCV